MKRIKKFLKHFADEKSDEWVQILRRAAIIEYVIFILVTIFLLTKALFEWEGSYFLIGLVVFVISTGMFVINMVIVNALYNIQEIRKTVSKQYNEKEALPRI